jgi:hypothetical protein
MLILGKDRAGFDLDDRQRQLLPVDGASELAVSEQLRTDRSVSEEEREDRADQRTSCWFMRRDSGR